LKELAGNVSQTIEQAKKKINGLPKVEKELNPLWGLLAGMFSPLPSIIIYMISMKEVKNESDIIGK